MSMPTKQIFSDEDWCDVSVDNASIYFVNIFQRGKQGGIPTIIPHDVFKKIVEAWENETSIQERLKKADSKEGEHGS